MLVTTKIESAGLTTAGKGSIWFLLDIQYFSNSLSA